MIVYYLGAGASYNALPLVDGFFRYEAFDLFSSIEAHSQGKLSLAHGFDDRALFSLVKRLINESEEKQTVDSFANKLSKGDDYEYIVFKSIITAYLFTIESINSYDKRYEVLIQNFHTGFNEDYSPVFKREFGFVSWNYDVQVEKVFAKVLNQNTVNSTIFNVLIDDLSQIGEKTVKIPHIKLNGSISINGRFHDNIHYFPTPFKGGKDELFLIFFTRLKELIREYRMGKWQPLNFAWDNNLVRERNIESAQQLVGQATDIVVIGYSFHPFNQDLDQSIFSKVQTGTRIFVQCPSKDDPNRNSEIVGRLKRLMPRHSKIENIESSGDFTHFVVPPQIIESDRPTMTWA